VEYEEEYEEYYDDDDEVEEDDDDNLVETDKVHKVLFYTHYIVSS
jgi:hypothetical protein